MLFNSLTIEMIPHKPDPSNAFSKQNVRKQKPATLNDAANKSLKVLIVEDEVLVAENIKEIIEDAGYTVPDVISAGEEAVSKCSKIDPDLIIMDIKLSGKTDGINAASRIHSTFKQVPIIFLTAYSQDQFPHLSNLRSDVFRFINKPYDMSSLPKLIASFLRTFNRKS
jgi:CheY-like chemotaxis protein